MAALVENPPLQAQAQQNPEKTYVERCAVYGARRDREQALSQRLSNIRLAIFGLAVLLGIFFVSGGGTIYLAAVGLLVVAFLALVVIHDRVEAEAQRYATLWAINDAAQKRLARRWKDIPARPFVAPAADHPYANDIDVFGPASLFNLLDVTSTAFGSATLQRWLLAAAPTDVVLGRQAAVAELAPLIDLRDEIALPGRLPGAKQPDTAPFLAWSEGEPWLLRRPLVIWAGRVLPLLTWVAILASATGVSPYPLWLAMLAINLALLAIVGVLVESTLASVNTMARSFRVYSDLMGLVSDSKFQSPELVRLQQALSSAGLDAAHQMRRLSRIANFSVPPSGALYLPLQLLTFWNLNTLFFLEHWQVENGMRVRQWLAALGEFEALASLAGLAHMHPEWAFPAQSVGGAKSLTGRALGHPLIAPAVRVDNDVEAGPVGTFLLVTGSNMSGKSTLLRSLGANIVLAQCGSVVCAASMSLPPLDLYTSIRIQDSLEQGISLFMAELLRLKQVVDAARADEQAGERTLFYLLDEILHGTNTAERQIAARRIIAHLLAQGAIGAVSSHDLQLADTPALAQARRDVHFAETFSDSPTGPTMTFDYRLRPGLATSTNALKLMQIVGLDLDDVETKSLPSS